MKMYGDDGIAPPFLTSELDGNFENIAHIDAMQSSNSSININIVKVWIRYFFCIQ
jgi:hypothetical protein